MAELHHPTRVDPLFMAWFFTFHKVDADEIQTKHDAARIHEMASVVKEVSRASSWGYRALRCGSGDQ